MSRHLPFALSMVVVAAACTATSPFDRDPAPQVRPGAQAEADSGAVVEGVVMDHESGDSLSGATVSLAAGPSGVQGRGTRVTDEGGAFRFEGVPEGTYRVSVDAPGYASMGDTLQVPAKGILEVRLPLSTGSVRLRPIIVEQRMQMLTPGYERRRAGGARFLITREEILQRRPRYVSELLNRVPGGIVVASPPYGYRLLLRNQCRPGLWLDGVYVAGGSVDQLVRPLDVEAVEVYHGFELPVEFGVDECGGILVWTRRAPPPPPPDADDEEGEGSGLLGGLLKAAIVIAIVYIIAG